MVTVSPESALSVTSMAKTSVTSTRSSVLPVMVLKFSIIIYQGGDDENNAASTLFNQNLMENKFSPQGWKWIKEDGQVSNSAAYD